MRKDTLHLKAPGNWINDPNGFICCRGRYHLFYQYFPYAPRWGTMHWGHAVSRDLVHWEHQGVALYPTKGYDRNGVFSGSALEKDGKLYLYYSAVRYLRENADDIHIAPDDTYETSQAMLISPDGMRFDNLADKRQIIPVLRDEDIGDAKDTRDPKVWVHEGKYYMILGSTFRKEEGKALFYRSEDGLSWHYVNQYASPEFRAMLECPDLFRLGEQYVLIGSPMGVTEPGVEYENHAMWALARFDHESCALSLESPMAYMDYGQDFYAPQTTLDQEGRRVVVGWMRMPQAVEDAPDGRGPWNGMMSLPRVMELREGQVYFGVHPNAADSFVPTDLPWQEVAGRMPFRLRATLSQGQGLNVCGYQIRLEEGRIKTDRSQVFVDLPQYRRTAETPVLEGESGSLEVYVEPNLIEVFVDGGRYVISHVVYNLGCALDGPVEELSILREQG